MKFEVGDCVRVIERTSAFAGLEGKIIFFRKSTGLYHVHLPALIRGEKTWGFFENEIELVNINKKQLVQLRLF